MQFLQQIGPMKTLKQFGVALASILALVFIIGLFFSRTVEIKRTASVRAPMELVYTAINRLDWFTTWNPWTSPIAKPELEYSPIGEGEGARVQWIANAETQEIGSWKIVEVNYPNFVKAELNFPNEDPGVNTFELEQGDNGMVRMTWSIIIDMGWNPFYRVLGKLMDMMAGPFVENGLMLLGNEALNRVQGLNWGFLKSEAGLMQFVPYSDLKEGDRSLEVYCAASDSLAQEELNVFFSQDQVLIMDLVKDSILVKNGAEKQVCLVVR